MDLPQELILQILLRLPVKSLMIFKCVCKLWFSVISDPHFANSHFQLNLATHTRRFLCISALSPEIQSIDFDAFLNDTPASPNFNCSLPDSYFPFEIKGSCRGFIFLYRSPNIYIWNPSTGSKRQIPMSAFNTKPYINLYGFGYDPSRDDYVVVALSNKCNPFLVGVPQSHLEFFSFRDNSWKEIEGASLPYIHNNKGEGVVFKGVIHWLASRSYISLDVIVGFDLMERKLFNIPLPNDVDHRALVHSGLWVFGEFLSIWVKDAFNDTTEIWVMKEYKVHSSWTKTLVLPQHVIPYHDFDLLYYSRTVDKFHPIYYTENGDIIGKYGGTRLVKYNDKGQFLGHHSFCNSPSEVVVYTESLLSLSGDNEHV